MGLVNNLTCRKCGTEEETSVHILCECEALVSLRHAYLGSFFFGPRGYYESKAGGHLEQGSSQIFSNYAAERACFKVWVDRARLGSYPSTNLI